MASTHTLAQAFWFWWNCTITSKLQWKMEIRKHFFLEMFLHSWVIVSRKRPFLSSRLRLFKAHSTSITPEEPTLTNLSDFIPLFYPCPYVLFCFYIWFNSLQSVSSMLYNESFTIIVFTYHTSTQFGYLKYFNCRSVPGYRAWYEMFSFPHFSA